MSAPQILAFYLICVAGVCLVLFFAWWFMYTIYDIITLIWTAYVR